MSDRQAIQHALSTAGIRSAIRAMKNLSGGCIHTVVEISLDDGQRLIAKINTTETAAMFEQEAQGLRALGATRRVLVPRPLTCTAHADRCVLLMTAITPPARAPTSQDWRRFGHELADLHQADAGARYGFDADNHIGSTPQPNSWHDDWVEFNAINRLGYQLALARDNGRLDDREAKTIDSVIERLDRLIPRNPKPALLHGDLWSGNAIPGRDDEHEVRIAIIDPAVYIGDGWADIAMMQLFGGFPSACFDAYEERVGRPDDLESRVAVYQLYHVLNHVNLFGRGYAAQALSIAKRLQ